MFYAFGQQATVGKNTEPAPGMFSIDFASKAKWSAWDQVAMLGSMEAMSYYVRSLEKIDATWDEQLRLLSAAAALEEVRLAPRQRLPVARPLPVRISHARSSPPPHTPDYCRARNNRGCGAPCSVGQQRQQRRHASCCLCSGRRLQLVGSRHSRRLRAEQRGGDRAEDPPR